MKSNFAEIFADIILKEFMGDVKLKQVDGPLQENEKPAPFVVEKKFMVLEEYFTNEKYALPPLLKKLAGETESNHEERVRKYLLACDDQRFSDVANLIDPQNEFQLGFFNLYNEIQALRISRISSKDSNGSPTWHNSDEKKRKVCTDTKLRCNIF